VIRVETMLAAIGLVAEAAVAQSQWQTRAAVPVPAGQAAIVRGDDRRFYLFGGWNTNPPSVAYANKLQIYDPRNDTWTFGADIPGPSIGDAAVVTASGRIDLLNAYFGRVYPYDPAANTWLASHAAPWVTYGARAVKTTDGRFFIFGGERPDSLSYEYFPETFTAAPRAEVPYSPEPSNRSIRFPGAYVETSNGIYVIGGLTDAWTTYGAMDDVAVYHPRTNTWREAAAMPTRRFSFAFVRGWNGYLYAIGGSDVYFMGSPPFFDVVEVYDPLSNSWAGGPSLPQGRRECAGGIDDNGVIYVFGGSGPPSGQYVNTVYAYDTCVGAGGPAPGDIDRDGDVDLADFVRFQACFNGPNRLAREANCESADVDRDGDVDLSDFGVFSACFNGPNRPPACS
jgi:N-acetylneuraminic acid mutarotase